VRNAVVTGLAVAAFLLTSPALPAAAQIRDVILAKCNDVANTKVAIDTCTALIDSGQLPGKNLSAAYTNRGLAYYEQADYDHAIADFDAALKNEPSDVDAFNDRGLAYYQKGDDKRAIADYDTAITLRPRFGSTFSNRGSAYIDKGDYDRAVADFDAAVRLNPKDAVAVYNRGSAEFLAGRFTLAVSDYARTLGIDPHQPYAVLWMHLSRERAGQDDRTEFAQHAAALDASKWPGPVVAFYLGKQTATQVAAAAASGDSKTQRGSKCEAAFYIGEDAALRHNPIAAARWFKRAVAICPHSFIEYHGALRGLDRAAK